MSNQQKLITITSEQLQEAKSGRLIKLLESMITIGYNLGAKGVELESVKGPYKNESDGSYLIILNIQDI